MTNRMNGRSTTSRRDVAGANGEERAFALVGGGGALATGVGGEDVTHVIFVLDRSGSMSGKEPDVIGGVNAYVDGLRGTDGAVGISYVRFDHSAELVWNDLPLASVPTMSAAEYSVRGNTALLDAVGVTVSAVRDDPEQRFIVIIHTDGEENASREWTREKVKALIEEREARGNWTFAFYGEGIDAWAQAGDMGFTGRSSAAYAARDTSAMFRANARVSEVMLRKKMRSSKGFAAAAAAAMEDTALHEDAIERILEEDAPEPAGATGTEK